MKNYGRCEKYELEFRREGDMLIEAHLFKSVLPKNLVTPEMWKYQINKSLKKDF